MMKIPTALLISASMLVAASCVDITPVYNTAGTEITLSIVESATTATQLEVKLTLADDGNYYFCGAVADSVYTVQEDNYRFMQGILDYEYKVYIDWRYERLKRNEEYVTDFASHCLQYGDDTKYFAGLTPKLRYMVFAFCVNPETNQPVGELFYKYVTTSDLTMSDMTFQFRYDMQGESAHITVIPSNDSDTYFWSVASVEDVKKEAGGSIETYAKGEISFCSKYGFLEGMCKRGFSETNYYDCFEDGVQYYVYAVGYDGGMTTDVAYEVFSYPFVK